ncbi:antitermination protein [Salmonella enterica subsp. enterica serovar Choleraesuis]|nr:antitermination protein [Salmonella enterica subsp. enterica serovar Choleraesuis]
MNDQYLEYVRETLIIAAADLSGTTKGQLVAFAENAQFVATARSRGRMKVVEPVTGRLVNPNNPPIPGQQSRAKGSAIALIQPVEYSTASWRRALRTLELHHMAWLVWCYADDVKFSHQVAITEWGWQEFNATLAGRRVAAKTRERLQALVWLAAQDVRAELRGRETYQQKRLAELVGVNQKNWSETFSERWRGMRSLFCGLDGDALVVVSKTRSQQKATDFALSLAKLD